jgi:hypothetical protein
MAKDCLTCGQPIKKGEPARSTRTKGSRFSVWRHENCRFESLPFEDAEISAQLQRAYNLGRKTKEAK